MNPPSLPPLPPHGADRVPWNHDMQDFLNDVQEYAEKLLDQHADAAALAMAMQSLFTHIEHEGAEPGCNAGEEMSAWADESGCVVVEHGGSGERQLLARRGDRWVDPGDADAATSHGDLAAGALSMTWWGDLDMIMAMTHLP